MPPTLDNLSDNERKAAVAVGRAAGAVSIPQDVGGRQGAVDVRLDYPDGRYGALEITSHAGQGIRQRDSVLARDRYRWDNPGRWAWYIQVDSAKVIPRLREEYAHIIELCERHGVTDPRRLPWSMRESDPGLRWFRGAGVAFHGMPDLVNDSSSKRPVWVMPAGGGGWVDEDLTGLPEAASNLLAVPHVRLRVQKLLNHPAHEHHLFVWLGDGGFPDNVWIAMAGHPRSAPSAPPQTPPGLTHLWLKTDYGSSLIGWSAAGWTIAEVTA